MPKVLPPRPSSRLQQRTLRDEVVEVVDQLKSDPKAQEAVHELQFAAATIARSGKQLIDALTHAIEQGYHEDERIRPWVQNAVGYARSLLTGGRRDD